MIVFLFFNSSSRNFISTVSWLELILGQSFWALWDEVMLLRGVWMLVIWLFISFSFNSETSDKISRRWLRSLILFSFLFIFCRIRVLSLKLSIIISSFEIQKEPGSVFVKILPESSKFSITWSNVSYSASLCFSSFCKCW